MKGELDASFTDRVLFPLLARTQRMGRRLTPEDASERIREKLELAGNPRGWTVERVMAGKVVGLRGRAGRLPACVALLLGLGFLPTLGVRGAGLAGRLHAPRTCTSTSRPTTARDKLQRALPGRDRPADHLGGVRPRLRRRRAPRWRATPTARCPRSSPGCCRRCRSAVAAPRRCGPWATAPTCPTSRSFVSAMVQADAFGIPVGQVLRVQSSEIRVKRRQWAEEAGAEGAGQDPGPADLLHPALSLHCRARSGGYLRS